MAGLVVDSPRIGKKLLVLTLQKVSVHRLKESTKATNSSSPLLGSTLETHRNRPILPSEEVRIVVKPKCSEGVHGVNVVDHVEVGSNHAATIGLAVNSLDSVAALLYLFHHAVDDMLEASLGDQPNVAGKDDHVVRLGRGHIVVIDDFGHV